MSYNYISTELNGITTRSLSVMKYKTSFNDFHWGIEDKVKNQRYILLAK